MCGTHESHVFMCGTHVRRVSESLMCSCVEHLYVGCQKVSFIPHGIVVWNTRDNMCSTHVLEMHVRRVSESLMGSCAEHMYLGCQKVSCVHVWNTCT